MCANGSRYRMNPSLCVLSVLAVVTQLASQSAVAATYGWKPAGT